MTVAILTVTNLPNMKKSNLYHQATAYAIALTCATFGLVGCSSDEDAQDLKSQSLISLNVETSSSASRAYWEYTDGYNANETLPFKWSGDETEIAVIQKNDVINGSLKTDAESQTAKLSFVGDANADTYFVYPYSTTPLEMTIAQTHEQDGKTTTHLANEMYMYGAASMSALTDKSTVQLNHATSILRFIVTNKRATPITNPKVVVKGSFYLSATLNCTYTDELGQSLYTETQQSYDNISVSSKNVSLATGEAITLYTLCMPTATSGYYTFQIEVDGMTYTSNIVKGTNINGFKSGAYYTFNLLLDDQLTVTSITANSFSEGWGSADDEIDLE